MPELRRAFTLVELLVVIAIIGILIALLLPAVQAARESARRTECTNHLKNLTLGMLNHESASGRLPSSGWRGNWTGDPDRGTGKDQPGCWLYSILPYIEQQDLYDLGSDKTGTARSVMLRERDSTPLPVMNCPSRRNGGPYFASKGAISGDGLGGVIDYPISRAARGDYAASVGDEFNFDGRCQEISPVNYTTLVPGFPPPHDAYSGVTFCGTAVELRQITDGLSKTIALGEKWIPVEFYEGANPDWLADDWAMMVGFQDDTVRSTYYDALTSTHVPRADSDISGIDVHGAVARELFGSAHPAGCLFSMCDGSVSLIQFDIDPEMFRQMGDRADEGVRKVYERRSS